MTLAPTSMCQAEEERLIIAYTPLVKRVAHRYDGMLEFEDMVQIGLIGLVEAIRVFKPEDGVPFGTVAHKRVKSRIVDAIRARYGRTGQRYAQLVSTTTMTEYQMDEAFGSSREEAAEDDTLSEWVAEAMEELSELQRSVIFLMYGRGMSIKAIAERWNVPMAQVSIARQEAFAKIRARAERS